MVSSPTGERYSATAVTNMSLAAQRSTKRHPSQEALNEAHFMWVDQCEAEWVGQTDYTSDNYFMQVYRVTYH